MRTFKNIALCSIIFCLAFTVWSCGDIDDDKWSSIYLRHVQLHVLNGADETIYLVSNGYASKELIMSEQFNQFNAPIWNVVHPGDSVTIYDARYELNYFHTIVLKQSTMEKYTKKEIIEEEIYDERYVFPYLQVKNDDKHALKRVVYTGD